MGQHEINDETALIVDFLREIHSIETVRSWIETTRRHIRRVVGSDIEDIVLVIRYSCSIESPSGSGRDYSLQRATFWRGERRDELEMRPDPDHYASLETLLRKVIGKDSVTYRCRELVLNGREWLGCIFVVGSEALLDKAMERLEILVPAVRFAMYAHVVQYQVKNPFVSVFLDTWHRLTKESRLTEREAWAITLRLMGRTYEATAEEMNISIHTVRKHVMSGYRKLGVGNYYQLVGLLTKHAAGREMVPTERYGMPAQSDSEITTCNDDPLRVLLCRLPDLPLPEWDEELVQFLGRDLGYSRLHIRKLVETWTATGSALPSFVSELRSELDSQKADQYEVLSTVIAAAIQGRQDLCSILSDPFHNTLLQLTSDHGLKESDMEVLDMQLNGYSHKEIVDRIHIEPGSLRNRMNRIYRQSNVRSFPELFARYFISA